MLKKMILGSTAVAVLAFAALAAGWWFFVRADAQLATDPPEIPAALLQSNVTPADSSGTSSAVNASQASTGTLAFDVVSDSSEAAYFADEQLASIGVPSTAKGSTSAVTGTFYLAADGWSLDAAQHSTFTVDLRSLTSDESRRDSRVQQALDTSDYPTATFTVTSIDGVDSSLPQDEQQTFTVTGILDLHGVQKEVTWTVEARRAGNVITALATTNFNYADFNIPVLNIGGFVSVQDDVTLQVQIIAQAA